MYKSADEARACDLRAARVRDTLKQWSDRLSGHCQERRAVERSEFHVCIVVYVSPQDGSEDDDHSNYLNWSPIGVTTRNISSEGVSFLYHDYIRSRVIAVCLREELVLAGRIVRQRQVHDSYWEYGVYFTGRIPVQEAAHARADSSAEKSRPPMD